MIAKTTYHLAVALGLSVLAGCSAPRDASDRTPAAHGSNEASGTFKPTDRPMEPPVKIEAGKSCIVKVKQSYTVSGTLTGSFEIDYRILVFGPCGSPPATFDEEWIAHGAFDGTINGSPATGRMSYVATVQSGGNVGGWIVLGQGIEGELQVQGNFRDGSLTYAGWARETR